MPDSGRSHFLCLPWWAFCVVHQLSSVESSVFKKSVYLLELWPELMWRLYLWLYCGCALFSSTFCIIPSTPCGLSCSLSMGWPKTEGRSDSGSVGVCDVWPARVLGVFQLAWRLCWFLHESADQHKSTVPFYQSHCAGWIFRLPSCCTSWPIWDSF